jgi:hypothetical protein
VFNYAGKHLEIDAALNWRVLGNLAGDVVIIDSLK